MIKFLTHLIPKKENAKTVHPIFSNPLMAHALGGYEGLVHLNSRLAFERSLELGFRYFEIDLDMTSDGHLVVCHAWNVKDRVQFGLDDVINISNLTLAEIKAMDLCGHKVMDAREFYELMRENKNLYFEVDLGHMKGDDLKIRINHLVKDFKHNRRCLNRLLIQVFTKRMWQDIDAIYHFKYYQFVIGKRMEKLDKTIEFCRKNDICALALRFNLAKPKDVKKIKDAGLHILCYTIRENVWAVKKLLESGVDTVCTDFVTPELLENYEYTPYNPYYIYYNSGMSDVSETYSDLIKTGALHGNVKNCPSGNLEFTDQDAWHGSEKRNLVKNCFTCQTKRFVGWKMRVTIDNKVLWLCSDGYYRYSTNVFENEAYEFRLFSDEELLPVWTAAPDMKYVMVAVWEDL